VLTISTQKEITNEEVNIDRKSHNYLSHQAVARELNMNRYDIVSCLSISNLQRVLDIYFHRFQTLDTHWSMAVIISVKFHHKRSNDLQNRKFKFCYIQVPVVSMATTVILEMVYVAKALTHDGYHL
jgi:hypothetical protein